MAISPSKQITFRLPRDLYSQAAAVAKRRKTSVNALVREGLEAVTRRERDEQLRAAFEELARTGEHDVEHTIPAFNEVLRGND